MSHKSSSGVGCYHSLGIRTWAASGLLGLALAAACTDDGGGGRTTSGPTGGAMQGATGGSGPGPVQSSGGLGGAGQSTGGSPANNNGGAGGTPNNLGGFASGGDSASGGMQSTGGASNTGGGGNVAGQFVSGVQLSCDGLEASCGPGNNENCCASPLVPGGTFSRYLDNQATVSSFRMNRFEVTVGRFRKFVEQYDAWRGAGHPQVGAGAHPVASNTGWRSEFNADLPANAEALKAAVRCDEQAQTWTDAPGANENRPQNCLDWYVAFAFCAWDGSRMPTETENNYARAGGDEQRDYPWSQPNGAGCSSMLLGKEYASYECGIEGDLSACIFNVGELSKGDSRWGHADLAGNLWEWNFDWYEDFGSPCMDCAITEPVNGDDGHFARTINGCGWPNGSSGMCQFYRGRADPKVRQSGHGVRCVLPT